MSAANYDIVIEQGSTLSKTISVKDSSGDAVNLSDVTSVRGQVRKNYAASESYAFTLAVTSAASGLISWSMDAVTSASIPVTSVSNYIYDVELVRTSNVQRLLQGNATIIPEVTR
jgi:hypothetical protein